VNVEMKGVPNGKSGYCKTMRTETHEDMRDRKQIGVSCMHYAEYDTEHKC